MTGNFSLSALVSWIFILIFVVLGMMNLILVHPVPGIFYILFSGIFFPSLNTLLKKKTGMTAPLWIRIILGLIVLWGTLAVGDLAEIYGF